MTLRVRLLEPTREYARLREELIAAADGVLSSGRYILGPEVEEFENEIAIFLGGGHGVGVASGTDALWLALRDAGAAGKKVVTSAFTFFATAGTIVNENATPVLVDIDPRTFNIDPSALTEVLNGESDVHRRIGIDPGDVAVIVPVHLYGMPYDVDRVGALAVERGLPVIEDAAQALGSAYGSRMVGAFGDYACFSFFPSKNLGAFGDAGLVVTRETEIASRLKMLRAHGAAGKYHHVVVGTNSRLDPLQAALLRVKLRDLDRALKARRDHAGAYDGAFQDLPGVTVPYVPEGRTATYHQYTIRVSNRDAVAGRLKEAGVETAVHYPRPLHMQPALSFLGYREGDFPHSERAAREVLSLPVFPDMTVEEREHVIDSVTAAVAKDVS